jgi:heptosyltransferase I
MSKPPLPLQEAPRELFVLRFSALGDVCQMVPVIRSISSQWPETRITWCLGRQEYELLGDMAGIEFVLFEKSQGWRAYRDLRNKTRSTTFDVLMHAQFSMRSNLASRVIKTGIRLGYDRRRSKDLHSLFISHSIPPATGQHVMDSYFSFAETLGVTLRDLRWEIPIPDDAQSFVRRELPDAAPVLLINPCSSHALRNWSPERFAQVGDYAASRHGFQVVLCGGRTRQEEEAGQTIAGAMNHAVINLIGKDTIKQLLALLARAQLLITPDSGPMHMATAVGTPVIGLHAASNPDRSGPYFSRQWCVNRYDDAARQFLGKSAEQVKWGTKIERPGVMGLVTVDDVVIKLDAFLDDHSRLTGSRGDKPDNTKPVWGVSARPPNDKDRQEPGE